jgi:hypothetical protein
MCYVNKEDTECGVRIRFADSYVRRSGARGEFGGARMRRERVAAAAAPAEGVPYLKDLGL